MKKKARGAYQVRLSLHLCLLQKCTVLNVFTPPFPTLFFSSLSVDDQPCLVHGAWHNAQAKRLPGNRRGCTFGPNYSSQPPPSPSLHLHLNWFLLLKEKKTPSPTQPLCLAVLRAGGVLWRWMSGWPWSLLFRPCWGLHIMKGTWGEQGKADRGLERFILYSAVPA